MSGRSNPSLVAVPKTPAAGRPQLSRSMSVGHAGSGALKTLDFGSIPETSTTLDRYRERPR